jgi:UDP-N-acetylglucosamine diphosphorylase/glucosamine-1-phosphate N-acetyltransferase
VIPLYLLEPAAPGAAWAPFTGVRPVAELRAGLWRIRERWERALGQPAAAIIGAHTEGFHDADEPPCTAPAPITGPAVVVTSAFAPATAAIPLGPDARRLVHGNNVVGWIVPAGERFDPAGARGRELPVEGVPLPGSYALLDALDRLLADDCAVFRGRGSAPAGALVLGDPSDVVSEGATIEPGVVFDVRPGPVVIEAGAEVRSGARLEGPTFVGAGTRVLGGYVRGSVFGPECRVRGEIAASAFLGYANKAHDGFVGNSVVGRWVNLGAGTTTSNLKNTYGRVRLDVAGERIETGRLNVGTLFGDHAKTAIGTMLPTGTVVSVGANLFGGTVPKYVPPFAWGLGGERMTEEGFLRVAERVLARRDVAWTDARRESLRRTYRRTARP